MKLRRQITALLLVLTTLLCLAACAGGGNQNKKPSSGTENGTNDTSTIPCPHCKENNPVGQKFCGNCGKALKDESSPEGSDGSTGSQAAEGSQTDEPVEKRYSLTALTGDYFCLPEGEIRSEDPQTVSLITGNLLHALKSGSTMVTCQSGNTTYLYSVTVLDPDTSFMNADYRTLSKEEVDKAVNEDRASFIDQYAQYEEVTDRTNVQMGDKVSIDYVGTMDGVAFEGGTGSYDLVIGSHSFIDGFEEGLVDATVGSTVKLNLYFPDPYPNSPDLAGKPVLFTVTVKSIKAPEAYTDQFVQRVTNKEYTTVESFEEYLKKTAIGNLLFDKLKERIDTKTLPEALTEQYCQAYLDEMISYLASMGVTVTTKEEIISLMGYTEESFDQMLREGALNTLSQDYVFFGYCKAKELILSETVFEECKALYLARYECDTIEELVKNYNVPYDSLYEIFLYEEILRSLYNESVIV
ncbi:MAG: hypothetical protein E7599_06660 [Ruminococcaceae bacterium]|nr:hypothetical protein [Oscillospiraceae bacterium]